MSELWDVYTRDRKLTGKKCIRGEQGQLSDEEFHLWVMVWIKNPETGKYLVSQRAADKDTDPLKWETVAGHVIAGENSLQAAVREVYEEVGISLQPEDATVLATKVAFSYDGRRHNWIRDSYYFETTQEPDLQKATTNEVIQTRWLALTEIRDMYDRGECCLNMKDVYLWGENSAVEEYTGKVIAVYHRYDDNENKWIVVPCDADGKVRGDVVISNDDEIYAQIAFQEQFFSGVLVRRS